MANLNGFLNEWDLYDNRTDRAGSTGHKNRITPLICFESSPTLLCGLDREEGLSGCGKRRLRFARSSH